MGLVLEVAYESAAGLRRDYDTQLNLGGLFVSGSFPDPLEPFAELILILAVDGAAPLRVSTRLTVMSPESLCVEVLPESAILLGQAVDRICGAATAAPARRSVRLVPEELLHLPADEPPRDEGAPAGGELTLDRRIAAMSVGEKVRLAATGGREERAHLARDRAGVIQASLVRNPRVTVDEVLALARGPQLAGEAAEAMAAHKSWGASPQIALALVRNPRTPLALAIEQVEKLLPSDLRVIAKGTGVRAQVAGAARKRLLG